MSKLSISQAWDDSRAVLARDGRLLITVALALLVLPAVVVGAVTPGGLGVAMVEALQGRSAAGVLLLLLVLLVILVGQLAITRLVIGPSVSVGSAIAHAVRRLPFYVAVALIAAAAMLVALMIIAIVVALASGGKVPAEELAKSPGMALAVLAMFFVYLFLLARVISISAAVTSTEPLGPIAIIRRCWSLTSGHLWRMLGFLVLYFLGTGVLLFAINSVVGLLAQLALGKIEPMSASTLVTALVDGLTSGAVSLLLIVMLARIYVQLANGAVQPTVPSTGI